MSVSYALAAVNAIMSSGSLEAITEVDSLNRDVKEGDLMACITLTSGAILTIPCAYLRITGPRQLRGMFDAHISGRLETNIQYTLKASEISELDYFVL